MKRFRNAQTITAIEFVVDPPALSEGASLVDCVWGQMTNATNAAVNDTAKKGSP